MPHSPAPGSAAEWQERAIGKLALARQPLPAGAYLEDLCYMAQQAAELAIKAIYQHRRKQFAFTHDLGLLLDELAESGLDIPDPVQEADQLIVYATQARYPGLIGPVSEQDYRQALVIAEAVVAWAQTIVQ